MTLRFKFTKRNKNFSINMISRINKFGTAAQNYSHIC